MHTLKLSIREAGKRTSDNPTGLDLLPFTYQTLRVYARSGKIPGAINVGTDKQPRWMISREGITEWWNKKLNK